MHDYSLIGILVVLSTYLHKHRTARVVITTTSKHSAPMIAPIAIPTSLKQSSVPAPDNSLQPLSKN